MTLRISFFSRTLRVRALIPCLGVLHADNKTAREHTVGARQERSFLLTRLMYSYSLKFGLNFHPPSPRRNVRLLSFRFTVLSTSERLRRLVFSLCKDRSVRDVWSSSPAQVKTFGTRPSFP